MFRDDLIAKVSREMQRPLSTKEAAAVRGYLPDGMDPDEIAGLLRLFERSGGRKTTGADSAPPEWWAFYVERVVRSAWGRAAETVRLGLGLTRPLPEAEAADYVRKLIRQEAVPERGANGYLAAQGKDGLEIFTVWTGDEQLSGPIGNLPTEDVVAAVANRSAAYLTLVYLASGVPDDGRTRLGASGADFVAFMLSDSIPDWPWTRWSTVQGNYYADNLYLHIGSIAATPDQVVALYEEARSAIVDRWDVDGRPVPIALSAERIRLVRFVEAQAGRGPYDWPSLHAAWSGAGGDYVSPGAMKTAFYQSSLPVKRYRRKSPKGA